jgi:hypothetical protein
VAYNSIRVGGDHQEADCLDSYLAIQKGRPRCLPLPFGLFGRLGMQ